MKKFNVFISSILAGILIAIGGISYIAYHETSALLAAVLFSFGLFTIITMEFHLYTGKIGYLFDQKPKYLLELLVILIGNVIGSVITGIIIHFTRFYEKYQDAIDKICQTKLNDHPLSIFILSVFCGIMIYLAVEVSKKIVSGFQKTVAICVPVIIFIVCGFEHVVANTFYFAINFSFNFKVVSYFFLMLLGNSVGSILIWGLQKLIKKE